MARAALGDTLSLDIDQPFHGRLTKMDSSMMAPAKDRAGLGFRCVVDAQ